METMSGNRVYKVSPTKYYSLYNIRFDFAYSMQFKDSTGNYHEVISYNTRHILRNNILANGITF